MTQWPSFRSNWQGLHSEDRQAGILISWNVKTWLDPWQGRVHLEPLKTHMANMKSECSNHLQGEPLRTSTILIGLCSSHSMLDSKCSDARSILMQL